MRDDLVRTSPLRAVLLGFLAGALSVLAFHQVMTLILTSAGMINGTPYNMAPVQPLGVPTIVNQMFWGGLWGALFALIAERLTRRSLLVAGVIFGLAGPLLANWFVVSSIKGQPLAAGYDPTRMMAGVLIAGSFGLGLAMIYGLLLRRGGGDRTRLA